MAFYKKICALYQVCIDVCHQAGKEPIIDRLLQLFGFLSNSDYYACYARIAHCSVRPFERMVSEYNFDIRT